MVKKPLKQWYVNQLSLINLKGYVRNKKRMKYLKHIYILNSVPGKLQDRALKNEIK